MRPLLLQDIYIKQTNNAVFSPVWKKDQLTQHNGFIGGATNLSRHLSMRLGQQFKHALYLFVLVRRKCFEFTNTNVHHGNSFSFPIPEGEGHVTLPVRICSDGFWTLHTFKQIVPEM